jgi:mono/diheme cytochrome c family protein
MSVCGDFQPKPQDLPSAKNQSRAGNVWALFSVFRTWEDEHFVRRKVPANALRWREVEAIENMGRILLGVILGIVLVPLAAMCWFHFGHPPVAVADPPLPMERQITGIPLRARINSEIVNTPPIQADENTFVAGAQIYRDQCAACHGVHGKPSSFGVHMFPRTPQLWEKHRNSSVVGVSDDPPGATYWRVVNGIRLTGMPSYKDVLTETEMWQVTLLLANADKPLPPAALDILRGQPAAVTPASSPAAATKKP